jgi:hypothetical protein
MAYNSYDESITVGTLITAYHKGYHILERIEFLTGEFSDDTPVFYYTKIANDDGTPSRADRNSCHAGFCVAVTRDYIDNQLAKELNKATLKHETLEKLL